jgi:hypothetical protein
LVHVIARAKDKHEGYMHLEAPQKRIDERKKVTPSYVFDFPQLFEEAELTIYGEPKTVRYYCTDLLWKLHQFCDDLV